MLQDVLNYENFVTLSQEAQESLCLLLPPTAFSSYRPELPSSHPAIFDRDASNVSDASNAMDVDSERTPANLNPNTFTSSAFLAAATTYQDHIYSSWMTATSEAQLAKFKQGIQDGSLHAEWKDDAWDEEASPQKQRSK